MITDLLKLLFFKKNNFWLKKIFNRKKIVIDKNHKEIFKYCNEIKKNGYCIIHNFLSKENCDLITKSIDNFYLNNKNKIWIEKSNSEYRIFGAEKINKEIMNFFLNKTFISVGSKCFGRKISNLMTMANKVNANNNNLGSGGGWHRDDVNFQFKAIMYLSDVTDENGPFQLIRNSNKFFNIIADSKKLKLDMLNTRMDDKSISSLDQSRVETITGKAGTLILVDTSLIHRGKPLVNGYRYALTNYYYPYYQVDSMKNHFLPKI